MIIVFILFLFAVSCQTASGHSTAMILIKLGHGETKCISEMFDQFDEPMFKVGITGVSVQPNANKVLLTVRLFSSLIAKYLRKHKMLMITKNLMRNR
jgi:hypothetical protein